MRRTRVLELILLLAAGLAWGCSSKQATTLKGDEVYFAEGQKALQKKRYLEAVEKFQRLVSNYPGSPLVADAQYYLAEAYFRSEDYVNAVFEYQRLVDAYPASQWLDEAQFQIAESYFRQRRRPELDQKETDEALTHFRLFLEDHPDSPLVEEARQRIAACRGQLAHKIYLNARLYHRQGYLEAAAMIYQQVMQDFPDTEWYYEALAQLGEVALEKKDPAQARSCWEEVARDTEDEELRARVKKRLAEEIPGTGG